MSRFFRAKKKLVSMAGGSGAGRKIIKSQLGEDGVILLRVLKTVTRKLHGKKQSKVLKKSLMKFAVKGGYLFKENKLTPQDAKTMSLPMEQLFRHGIDATKADGAPAVEAAAAAGGAGKSDGETKATDDDRHASDEEEEDEGDSDDDDDIPAVVSSSATSSVTSSTAVPAHLQPHIQAMSEQLIALDNSLKSMLKPHMKKGNVAKLSKTVLFYSDPQWLTFFLTAEQCKEERISTYRIFSQWYERTFQPIVERRERRKVRARCIFFVAGLEFLSFVKSSCVADICCSLFLLSLYIYNIHLFLPALSTCPLYLPLYLPLFLIFSAFLSFFGLHSTSNANFPLIWQYLKMEHNGYQIQSAKNI